MSQILCLLNNALSQGVHIDMSADVDLLHFAVTKGLKEHVRILLEHGFVSFLFFLSMQYLTMPCIKACLSQKNLISNIPKV